MKDSTSFDQIDTVESVFNDKAVAKDNREFARAHRFLFPLAIGIGSLLLIVMYLFSSVSRIKVISVEGNRMLTNDQIRTLSGLKENGFYYGVIPAAVENRVAEDDMIAKCAVQLKDDRVVQITVTEEEPIGYRYDGDQPELLLKDGRVIPLKSSYMSIISRVPLITGFDEEEQTHLLIEAFADVSQDVISDMAEITQYPMSYDDQTLEVQMRDGGYFFASYYSLDKINEYTQYAKAQTNKDYCFYSVEDTSVVSSRACPWNTTVVPKEYWTTESGNYIYNRWGDKAIKHYYHDESGYFLDQNGNYIPIPLDANGDENPDPEFVKHYDAGWYATGTLVIPQADPVDEAPQEEASPEEPSGDDGSTEQQNADEG